MTPHRSAPLRTSIALLALAGLSLPGDALANIVVSHDVNTFAVNRAGADEATFAVNVADYLTGGSGDLLLFESNTDNERNFSSVIITALEDAGYAVTVTDDYSTAYADYDAIFVSQDYPTVGFLDNTDLINYAEVGGGVYLAAGVSSAAPEAAGWADFMNYFGLDFYDSHNGLYNVSITSTHAIFDGISNLECGNGAYIEDLGTNPNAQLVEFVGSEAVYAVVDVDAGPQEGDRDFDVVSVSAYDTEGAAAYGSSNGVGWAICETWFSSCCGASTTDGYTGFNTSNFDPPVAAEDNLHITSRDFVLVFEQPVDTLAVYLRENGGSANLDFGLIPEIISGGSNLTIVDDTRIYPNTSGGAVRYREASTDMFEHVSNIADGTNMAFYVEGLAPGVNASMLTGSGEGLCDTLSTDGNGTCDDTDVVDTDGDGVADDCDPCPADSPDDTDGDGVCDSEDACPDDAYNDADGDGVCGDIDPCPNDNPDDTDGDGVCDSDDQCSGGDDNADADGDGVADFCDVCPDDNPDDSDSDGVCESDDVCPGGDDNADADGDGVADYCDACPADNPDDTDGDGVCDSDDPCPMDVNDDTDGDGVCDSDDVCPYDVNDDSDGDGSCDSDDLCEGDDNTGDSDADGVCDDTDTCPYDADNDADGDGVCGDVDECADTPAGELVDDAGCSIDQYCPCDGDWENHGEYTSCVAHVTNDFKSAGLISGSEKGDIQSEAGASDCGKSDDEDDSGDTDDDDGSSKGKGKGK